jgi:hypothetical protein
MPDLLPHGAWLASRYSSLVELVEIAPITIAILIATAKDASEDLINGRVSK